VGRFHDVVLLTGFPTPLGGAATTSHSGGSCRRSCSGPRLCLCRNHESQGAKEYRECDFRFHVLCFIGWSRPLPCDDGRL